MLYIGESLKKIELKNILTITVIIAAVLFVKQMIDSQNHTDEECTPVIRSSHHLTLKTLILDENIQELERLSSTIDFNSPFKVSEYTTITPLELALVENKTNVVKWLISKGVDLNTAGSPSIVTAAANSDLSIIELLLEKGADINALDNVGKGAPKAALYAKRQDVFKFIIDNGYDLKRDGSILRKAVSDKNYEAVDFLIKKDIDVNFCLPDMVYPYNSTPVLVAAENNDFGLVKKLVENGADITISDDYGNRPYIAAFKKKNSSMMKYLAALEPKKWHDKTSQEEELINKYKVPMNLLSILKSNNRRIEIEHSEYIQYVEFNPLLLVREVEWKGYKFLDLLSDADQYWENGFLVWYPEKKCLANADYEHEEFKIIGKWDDFEKTPSILINKIWD